MKRVLFDSDVLLDVLAQRQEFIVFSALALDTVARGKVQGYVSGHAVTNIFYILRRQLGNKAARELISRLLQRLQVASVTDEVIRRALQSSLTDFEDAVTSETANAEGLELIVTRNGHIKRPSLARTTCPHKSDFVASSVPAILPEEFLATLSE